MSALLDQQFGRAKERAFEDLARRGVLQSGETTTAIGDLETQLANTKGALLGQLGSQFESQRQQAIQQAISTFGILEGNRVSAQATITSANIGAAAQVRSAGLSAGATRDAAAIGAQARIQVAGLDAQTALAQLEQQKNLSLIDQGIDPAQFESNPQYRSDVFTYFEDLRMQEKELNDALIDQILGQNAGLVP
jgi:hypothetical protein